MRKRLSITTLVLMSCALTVVGCSSLTSPEADAPENALGRRTVQGTTGTTISGPITPIAIDKLGSTFDQTGPSVSATLQHPGVTTWRVRIQSALPKQDFLLGEMNYRITADLWGWDASGQLVADGRAFLDVASLRSTSCTVSVQGTALDMQAAGQLFETIVGDFLDLGPAKLAASAGCWWLAAAAAWDAARFIAFSGAAITSCSTLPAGLWPCVASIIAQYDSLYDLAESLIAFACECIPNFAELNPELCSVSP